MTDSFNVQIERVELAEALHRATKIGASSGSLSEESILKLLPRKTPNKRTEWSDDVLQNMASIPSTLTRKGRSFAIKLSDEHLSKLFEEARLKGSVDVPKQFTTKIGKDAQRDGSSPAKKGTQNYSFLNHPPDWR